MPLPSGIVRRHVLLGAAITALGGLLFGYDTGVISGALRHDDLHHRPVSRAHP